MDNYKQNNGEQSNNTELCPATAPALSSARPESALETRQCSVLGGWVRALSLI